MGGILLLLLNRKQKMTIHCKWGVGRVVSRDKGTCSFRMEK